MKDPYIGRLVWYDAAPFQGLEDCWIPGLVVAKREPDEDFNRESYYIRWLFGPDDGKCFWSLKSLEKNWYSCNGRIWKYK